MSDKSENAPSSSEKSSESEGEAPYSSDDEKHRYTSEERRDLEVAYPIFQHGCEVHKLPFLAKISLAEYDQFVATFGLNTDNWDQPDLVAALYEYWRRGTIPLDGIDPTAIADRKAEIEGYMVECEEALKEDRMLNLWEKTLVNWLGTWLARSGKIYASEGSYQRWLTLAETFRKKQKGDLDFKWFEFFGLYLRAWDIRKEEEEEEEEEEEAPTA